jgi:hypothetical protein
MIPVRRQSEGGTSYFWLDKSRGKRERNRTLDDASGVLVKQIKT